MDLTDIDMGANVQVWNEMSVPSFLYTSAEEYALRLRTEPHAKIATIPLRMPDAKSEGFTEAEQHKEIANLAPTDWTSTTVRVSADLHAKRLHFTVHTRRWDVTDRVWVVSHAPPIPDLPDLYPFVAAGTGTILSLVDDDAPELDFVQTILAASTPRI